MSTPDSLVNQLIQLQELIAAKIQKKMSMPSALGWIDQSINALSADLAPSIKTHMNRLLQKHPEAVVPVVNENCTGCGMALTKSVVQSVIKAEKLCVVTIAPVLYDPAEVVERDRVTRQIGKERMIGIKRYSAPNLMIMPLKGATPEEVLGELCGRMTENGFKSDPGLLKELALQREAIDSTAVDSGLAFPHVRGVEGGGLALAVGISRKGVKFGGPGRSLTRIFFLRSFQRQRAPFTLN